LLLNTDNEAYLNESKSNEENPEITENIAAWFAYLKGKFKKEKFDSFYYAVDWVLECFQKQLKYYNPE
jgi:hypothetical protein